MKSQSVEDISSDLAAEIDSALSLNRPNTLEAISEEIQSEATEASDVAVREELSSVEVSSNTPGDSSVKIEEDSTEVQATGTLETNLQTSGLSTAQKQEVEEAVENSIKEALQSQGVLTQDDKVSVDIDDQGDVTYEVDKIVEAEVDTTLEDILEEISPGISRTCVPPLPRQALPFPRSKP